MTRTEYLERRIARLEEQIDLLLGKQSGPISLAEARLANERGDMAIVEMFHKQYQAERRLHGIVVEIS